VSGFSQGDTQEEGESRLPALVDINPSLLAPDRSARQHGPMPIAPNDRESVELVKLRPAERQARFYRLAIWPDLFGWFSLAREYVIAVDTVLRVKRWI